MVQAAIQSVDLQSIDGGFHRGVLAAQIDEFGVGFVLAPCLGQLALLRHHHLWDQGGQRDLIGRTVEPLVEAGAGDVGKPRQGRLDE